MGCLINLDEPDTPPTWASTAQHDDTFNEPVAQRGEQDLIVLYDDLLDLNTPPASPPESTKQPPLPSSPLLSAEEALRLFEPPQYHYSPELTPVNGKNIDADVPLIDIDCCTETDTPWPPPPAPPVPRAPPGSHSSSQSRSRSSSQPAQTQLSSTRVHSVPTHAARAAQFVPSPETHAQPRPFSGRPGESSPPIIETLLTVFQLSKLQQHLRRHPHHRRRAPFGGQALTKGRTARLLQIALIRPRLVPLQRTLRLIG